MNKFQEQKQKQLKRKDKSNEGKWDSAIVKLCEMINSKKEYYTTSSCGGRISLVKGLKEKAENVFLFKTHDKISFRELKKELEKASKYKGLIYFKQEPCILHVACLNEEKGSKLLIRARIAGWKRSGMIATSKRVMLELMSTEKLELPIMMEGKILVDDDYLRLLVKEANKKLEKVREKINKFENLI
tara:strand:- start:1381 stop:1941 length:561 start_codon:yes stop_codon:yes gene_type:complete